MKDIISAVRAHAEANYNDDGWDYLVECWEDKDILEFMNSATTVDDAIKACHEVVKTMNEQRQEVKSMVDW